MKAISKKELNVNESLMNNISQTERILGILEVNDFNKNGIRNIVEASQPIQSELTIGDVIKPGKLGITRSQIHPAVMAAIKECSKEKLTLIKESYPEHFDSAVSFMNKKSKSYLKEIGLFTELSNRTALNKLFIEG